MHRQRGIVNLDAALEIGERLLGVPQPGVNRSKAQWRDVLRLGPLGQCADFVQGLLMTARHSVAIAHLAV